METGRERHREREKSAQWWTEPFLAPSTCPVPSSTHPAPWARGRVLGSEKCCQPPRSPAVPATCPALPGRGVPSSPESSHSSVRVEHPCVWGPGVGLGPRPWPGLSSSGCPSCARKQRNRFQGNFLFCQLPSSLPCQQWVGAGPACSREIPASLVSPGGLGGLRELRRRESLGGFQCRAETGQRFHLEEGPA